MNSIPSGKTRQFAEQLNAQTRREKIRNVVIGLVLLLALCIGAYYSYGAWKTTRQEAKAKQIAQQVAQAPRGPESFDLVRKAVDGGQITQEQARDAMRQAFESRMNKTMDDYFALPVGAPRNAYLDTQIDEMEKRMAERRARDANGPSTRPARPDRGPNANGGPSSRPAGDREARGRMRADTISPERSAKRAEFMAAIAKRRAERGLPPIQRGGGPGGWRP